MKIGNKKFSYTAVLVVLFLIFALFIWNKAEAETIFEAAPVVAYGGDPSKSGAIMVHERFKDKYDVGVVLLIDFDGEDGNRALEVLRSAVWNDWEAGLGYTLWANEGPGWNTDNTFTLVLGYHFTDRFQVRLRHWSTGGTSSFNDGMDMLTIGWRF